MRRLAAFLCAVVALASLAVPGANATLDRLVSELPLPDFRDMVADEAHGWVFVTGGSDTLVVRTLDGGPAAVLPGYPGASGLALSPDGRTLYVALAEGGAIAAVDTLTLLPKARYPVGLDVCPSTLAVTGSRVWFGYACNGSRGGVGVLDLSGVVPAVSFPLDRRFSYPPILAASPDGSHLVTGEPGISPAGIALYAVDGTTLRWARSAQVGSNLGDVTFERDGAHVVTAAGAPYHHPRWTVPGLVEVGHYGADHYPYPNAIVTAGPWVAAGTNGVHDPDVRVYGPGGLLLRTYDLGRWMQPSGLAITRGGSRVYAVTRDDPYRGALRLHVLPGAGGVLSTVAAVVPPLPRAGVPFVVTGALSPPGAATLRVVRSGPDGETALPDVVAAADGTFAFPDTAARRGAHAYRVTFDGDDERLPASSPAAFDVAGKVPALRLTTDRGSYPFHATATVTATLGATFSHRSVRIVATPYGSGPTEIRSGTVDATGALRARYTLTRATAFTVEYAGDEVYEPARMTVTRRVGVGLTSLVTGHHATSGADLLVRRTTDPVLRASVAPNRAGACTTVETQRYLSGAWRTIALDRCVRLDAASRAAYVLAGPHAPGARRMRVAFNGDASNLTTYGAWHYLRIT